MTGQIVGNSSSNSRVKVKLEPQSVRIFFHEDNCKKSDSINRVPGKKKSNLKLVFSPRKKTVSLFGNFVYVSKDNKSNVVAKKKTKFSFSYSVSMDRLSRLQIKSSRIGKKSDNNYTNTFSFKLTKSDARRLFTELQMGPKAIAKRFNKPSNNKSKLSKNKGQLTTVVFYLDKLPQKDLQDLSNMFCFISTINMDPSVQTLLTGEKNGIPTPQRSLKKTLIFSKELISKMNLLDEIKPGEFVISENLKISFRNKSIIFFVIYNETRIKHCLEETQLLGFELINSENCSSIHLTVDPKVARKICSKLIQPAPTLHSLISKFVEARKSRKIDHSTIRIHFKKMLEQEQIEHLKHIFPVIGKFPIITNPEEGYLNFENGNEVMDNQNDEDLLGEMPPPDQELSEVEEEKELKPLKMDVNILKIDQHTICSSSTNFNHYITLIVDDEYLRIIGNGMISQYIEEKICFSFKIPINSSEIDRKYEVNAIPGLKSVVKFSLTPEESNYVRGLFKKSLAYYGIDEKVDLSRFECFLATELNELELNHLLKYIKNLNMITNGKIKKEKNCLQDKDTHFSVQFENMLFGEVICRDSTCRKGSNQIFNLVINQNNSTITITGDLDIAKKKERKFKFDLPMNKINNIELKKVITKRKDIEANTMRTITTVGIIVYPDDFEMELIRQKLNNLKACPLDLIRNHLVFSTRRTIDKSYEGCVRILTVWQNSRNLLGQDNIQHIYNEQIVLICQSIHFGQFLYTGPNTCHISKSSDNSVQVTICNMQDFEGQNADNLIISNSGPPTIHEFENFKVNFFLSDYGVNYWILFFIPHQECQDSFASKLKYPRLKNSFDPSSEDMEKSYIRLVFEFPPSFQERDQKIEFCKRLTDIFETHFLSNLDLAAENNLKIIKKNLARINSEMIMEM